MGGMCDEKILGETPDAMIAAGMVHIEEAHPEMAASIKTMPKEDPKMVEWHEQFMTTWENTPENQ